MTFWLLLLVVLAWLLLRRKVSSRRSHRRDSSSGSSSSVWLGRRRAVLLVREGRERIAGQRPVVTLLALECLGFSSIIVVARCCVRILAPW